MTQQINSLLNEPISSLDKAYLNFTMAKIYEDHKEYDKSFNYLASGNECMKRHNKFNFRLYEKEMELPIHFFEKNIEHISLSEKNLDNKIHPIFILGMPRSGSSLIEQVLSNHPNIFSAGELDTIDKSLTVLIKEKNIDQNKIENFIYKFRKIYLDRLCDITDKPYVIDKLPLN